VHIALLASVATLFAAAPAAAAAPDPITQRACFGAASRDPAKPCPDPALSRRIFPAPTDAVLEPNAPCIQTRLNDQLRPCSFGVRPVVYGGLVPTIALVGDSHASHWRAAVDAVAAAKRQPAVSIARTGCAFNDATVALPHEARVQCRAWNRAVKSYLRNHPEVTTLFLSTRSSAQFVRARGKSNFETQVRGHVSLWRSLPATIRHIVVLRDTPRSSAASALCVQRQHAAGREAGRRCARSRAQALRTDPAVVAARRMGSPRVHAIDLSRFFCDARRCFPVVGGAAVYKDVDHMTTVFARSLGPYLLRAYDAILRASGEPAPRGPLGDLRADELANVACLVGERYAASTAGGFANVAPERLARATACRVMLEQRAAQLRTLGLTGERHRDRRYALIVAVLGA
jgi:SGNH domain-containing protein